MIKVDQVIRTDRKSIALIVKRDGRLVVRAPINATDEQILSVINRKTTWIEAKQQEVLSSYPQTSKKEFVNGEGFLYLGKSYRLKIIDQAETPLKLGDFFFIDRFFLPKAEEVFVKWYKERAYDVLSDRVAWYAEKIGVKVKVKVIKITSATSRWGSCSAKGTLSFPWRLAMAPVPVIDYVVIHELVHISEKNHSKTFWNQVHTLMPDYENKIAWLEINGHTLNL
ncbi:MAG TPA: SprT family zinc-dependent metalloprotease [Paludibacter sp.]|nr:SprT family zinc-dependent metalloprotease [Paludibacter sp.]HPM08890.1 SprT family zinc-dependent metalloprotease [Paludibacter sp.]